MSEIRLRPAAEDDLVDRTRYYRSEVGDILGGRFFDSALSALTSIGSMPGAGSPVPEAIAGVAGLRFRRIVGFRCGWFSLIRDDHVDVVRLLADAQDLPAWLSGELDLDDHE